MILRAEHVYKSVETQAGKLALLDDVSFSVKQGETVAIVGASGSGKSTLLGLLAGLDRTTQGDIFVRGQSLNDMNEDQRAELRGKEIGFIFQNFQLLPALTALENVMLPLELRHANKSSEQAQVFLARVGLSERLTHYPRQLSGGEQQRVAIARAFAGKPVLLFADEPTGNLDGKTAGNISDLLFDLNKDSGATLILVTHDERLAARCHRQLHMHEGRLAEEIT